MEISCARTNGTSPHRKETGAIRCSLAEPLLERADRRLNQQIELTGARCIADRFQRADNLGT